MTCFINACDIGPQKGLVNLSFVVLCCDLIRVLLMWNVLDTRRTPNLCS